MNEITRYIIDCIEAKSDYTDYLEQTLIAYMEDRGYESSVEIIRSEYIAFKESENERDK